MIVESLNRGMPKHEMLYGKEFFTGISKQPVSGALRLTRTGFEGDGVGDQKHHGGEDKAVCVYSQEHYPYWERVLGISLPAAAFGENLTISGLREEAIAVGDIFSLGSALVQVSQPRQPCRTLAARYGRDDLVKLVIDSGFTGFYFRVLREGVVQPGDRLVLAEKDRHGITVSFANRIYHHDRGNCTAIERVLAVPALSASWRASFLELKSRCER